MDQPSEKPSRRSAILLRLGEVLAVVGVLAMTVGLKVQVGSTSRDIVLIKSLFSTGGLVVFGSAAALIVAGTIMGRRKPALKNERPVEHQAPTDPLLLQDASIAERPATSASTTQVVEKRSSSSS